MKNLLCLLLSLGVVGARAASPPNILLILSDDQSVPHLGCYGNSDLRTPNFDRFAAEGMRFNKYFTVAPQCVPSRAGVMTGRSAVAARMTRFNAPLPRDIITLPEVLRAQGGYFTGVCRRSFHLDGPSGGRLGGLTDSLYEKHNLRSFEERVDFLDRNSPRTQTKAKVEEFFGKVPKGKPWFLWVNFNDPHHPWDKDAVANPPDPAKLKLPPELPDLPGVRSDLARFYSEVMRADEEFQWVLDIVKQRGFAENTLVLFAGDNGYAFPHGKGSLYDPGLNVPFLVRWPGKIKAGAVASELVSGEDLAPTCIDAAGLKAPKEMTGRSIVPLLRGQAYTGRTHIFAERGVHGSSTFDESTKASGYDLSRCVRSDRYKLIYNCTPWMEYQPVDSAGQPGWKAILAAKDAGTLAPQFVKAYFTSPRPIYELFDLQADPGELNNLAGRKELATIEKQLRHALLEKMLLDQDYLPLPPE
jgi:N-sulfoglucosamine sulfohydrolase